MPQHFIQDYITELSYVSNYYSDLTPKHLSFVAAINNFQPPDIFRPFAYCELGCGCGKTTNTVAACYPKANCIGVDINSDHIKIAKNESSGLSNIHFFDVSFKDALHLDLIKFDFIVMHGVWSWVNDSVRSDILKFVKKFLKTKGLFYISYDSMPGWTQLQPFHKIMSLYTKNMQCPLEEKAKSAMAYLQYLHINKSPFFERNPDAKCFLQLLERSDIRYIVHELFNEHLRPDYFCDVAAKMQNAGLSFVGNNSYIDNYYTILPEPFKELLGTANDRISLETHKSIIQNDRFRKDLYTKSKPSLDCEKNYLRNFIFGASKSIHDLRLKVDFSGYSVTLAANPYLTIFQLLSEKQLTIKELNKKLKRSPQKIAETIENIINCMLTN
ncbi:MAG: class I SAM-dependent methyltransferase, partial [Holosporaceae bacterium]|nr:class I SAM-dependent methyltransferase [Holosporaceae bacterium]